MLNRTSSEQRKSSGFPNLIAYLKPTNLLKLAVSLLALSAQIPKATASTTTYLYKNDGKLAQDLTDNQCIAAHPDCMLEITKNPGFNTYKVYQHCDGQGTSIPDIKPISDQIRENVFMGQKICEGVVINFTTDMANGLIHESEVNLSGIGAAVSRHSFFTKKQEAPKPDKCPEPTECNLYADGNKVSDPQWRWMNNHNQRLSCRK